MQKGFVMKIYSVILISIFLLSCGASQTVKEQKIKTYRFTQFGFSRKIDLKQIQLTQDELLSGYRFVPDMQAEPEMLYVINFYDGLIAYADRLGSVVQKSYQSVEGPGGDKGVIMYIEFDRPLDASTYTYLKKLFWGEKMTPSSLYSPEFFMSANHLVVWCLPMQSRIKEISQRKLFDLLNQP